MRQTLVFICLIFGVSLFSQRMEIHPISIMSGLKRSLPYARDNYDLKNPDLIHPNDTFPYVRMDGKVLLNPVKKGDCPWNIVKECVTEDSLRYYGDFNYEATLVMNNHLAKLSWLLEDANTLAGLAFEISEFANEINIANKSKNNFENMNIYFFRMVFLILLVFGCIKFFEQYFLSKK